MIFGKKINSFLVAVFGLIPFFLLIVPSVVSADSIGQKTQFFIDPKYDETERENIWATLYYVSDHAYFYVEDSFYGRISQTARQNIPNWLIALATEFEERIYPIETNFWGKEYSPGVDNDERVTIVLSPLIDSAGGYFDTGNENLKTLDSKSNQREMFFLNVNIINSTKRLSSFLAHEFQHLITFNQKDILRNISDDIWLNELRSEYSATLLGYNDLFEDSNLQRRLKAFLDFPSDSLTEWKNKAGDYGAVALFGEYVAEHYGSSILVDSLKSEKTGIASIDEALTKNNYNANFEEVFRNWSIANILNNIIISSNYGYFRDGLYKNVKIDPTKSVYVNDLTTFIFNGQIKDWQTQWFLAAGFQEGTKQVLEISFNGEDLEYTKVVLIAFSIDGKKQFQIEDLKKSNKIYISSLQNIEKIIFIPYKTKKSGSFGSDEPATSFTFSLQRISELPKELFLSSGNLTITPTPTPVFAPMLQSSSLPSVSVLPQPVNIPAKKYPDGSLLRARGDIKVYVINNGWKRHIVSPKIFNFYGHLGFDKVIEVNKSVVDSYPESRLIQLVGDKKIYELDNLNAKHFLDISKDKFLSLGRKTESVFVINQKEFIFYKTGASITK